MRKLNTSDVFKMFRIIKKTGLRNEVGKWIEMGKKLRAIEKDVVAGEDEDAEKDKASAADATAEKIGIDVMLAILDVAGNEVIEGEIYEFLAGINECEADAIKNQPIEDTVQLLKKIAEDNNIVNFFDTVISLTKKLKN